MSTRWIDKDDVKHESYVICEPGTYKLASHLSYSPKENKTSAIVIDADNVVLDLNGKYLKQSKCSKLAQITGVTVKAGHKNVTILGSYGVVKNFSQRGIYVEGNNKAFTLGDQTLLSVKGCGYGTPVSLQDKNETIQQIGIQLGDNIFMVWMGAGKYHGTLEDVRVVNVTCFENNSGISLGEGDNYSFSNCSFSNNRDYRLINENFTAPNLGAFYVENSIIVSGLAYIAVPNLPPRPGVPNVRPGISNITFEDCKFNSNVTDDSKISLPDVTTGNYCTGFLMIGNYQNLKIQNSEFNSNDASSFHLNNPLNVSKTTGCLVNSGDGTVIENCEFSNNKGGFEVSGLSLSGLAPAGTESSAREVQPPLSTTIKNCVAANNIANSPYIDSVFVYGIILKYASGFNMTDSTFEENRCDLSNYAPANPVPLNCFAFGMFIFSDRNFCSKFTNNLEIHRSKFSRNRVISPDTENTFGTSAGIRIFDDLTENVIIQNCVVNNNLPAFCEPVLNSDQFQTIGIDLFNETTADKTGPSYISVLNNVIQSNGDFGITNNMDLTTIKGNDIKNHVVAVSFQNSFYSSIINNTLVSNSTAIVDFDLPTTNLVAGNQAFDNQTFYCQYPYPVDPIAVCDPGDVPVDAGTLNSFPPLPSVSWSNTSINVPQGIPGPVYSCCDCATGTVVPCPPTSNARKLSTAKLFKMVSNRK